ncbi:MULTISPECIES: hypothetical protein [Bacillus amyloliquefaciens group]|uniref:hypothetical protein n=1 Tax=Bacillus amyloliquefaciens group TaxID=1938374 RepID=UPI00228054D6|nr:hypothetical protein [Bacillus velezensis]MCY7442904.1 hypothetical protein [Bacillus velezensis]
MNNKTNFHIEEYVEYMNRILESIQSLQGDDKNLLSTHKKTLYMSLIDSLSKGVLQNQKDEYITNNGLRFRIFIEQFCEWNEAKKVSVPQLHSLIKKTGTSECRDLFEYLENHINSYATSEPIKISSDLNINFIKRLLPKQATISNYLNRLTHISLIWFNRNNLVHEAHSAEFIINIHAHCKTPYYSYVLNFDANAFEQIDSLRIYYPVEFFERLIKNALKNIKPYLIKKKIDPINNYISDDVWAIKQEIEKKKFDEAQKRLKNKGNCP